MPDSNLHKLSALGQSVWIDFLSRDLLETGDLERRMEEDAVVGVTSNPTIFQKAISHGDRYDAQLREVLDSGEADGKEIFLQLSSRDIDGATDLLRPIWEAGNGRDGYVSWEVDPNFSLERHKEVMEAYIRGVDRLVEGGGDPSTVHSVASFFVSRVDTETDNRLDRIGGDGTKLKGKLGIANAKLAYQNYLETFATPRWQELEAKGATKQRCLWASTSTKNPEYRDVMYVEELIGPETVNTMPEETIKAFQDHGKVALTLTEDVDAARKLF